MSNIAFPGLGLEFTINRTAFTLFGLNIQWYALIIVTGIIAALLYFIRRGTKTEGLDEDSLLNICILTIPIAIIGARFVYVITSLDKYDSIWEMFEIWHGGLAIYGAIIFGFLTVLIYCRKRSIKTLKVLDALAPAVMIGQVIGRWGNFVNAEAYGYSAGVEKLPWRMSVGTVYIDGVAHPEIEFVHPTFLYESLWNLIGFILINIFYKHKKRDGQIFYAYIGWYGLGRGLLELLRTDSLRVFGVKAFVVLGLGSFAASIILMSISMRKAGKESAEIKEYRDAVKSAPVCEADGQSAAAADEDEKECERAAAELTDGCGEKDEETGEDDGNNT